VFCAFEPACKFDFQKKKLKKNGDQYFLRKKSLAGTGTPFSPNLELKYSCPPTVIANVKGRYPRREGHLHSLE
jgi:hypothetical protein